MTMNIFCYQIKRFFHLISNNLFSKALFKGSAAGIEHLPILKKMKCMYVVDIGANRGQFALAARKQFPQARIISFEPLAEPAAVFRRVFKSDRLTIFHQIAIGPEEKQMPMHVSRANDSSSLLPILALQSNLFPGTEEKEIRSVKVKPLSIVLNKEDIITPALLKIDVQGFELDTLIGCEDFLRKFVNIYIECSFIELYEGQALAHQIISWLKERNFFFSGVFNLYYDRNGTAKQGDLLFTRNIESR